MKSLAPRAISGTMALAALGLMAGCQDKLTHDNFSQIKLRASSQREVELVIGDPNEKMGEMWFWERPDKHITAMVDFDDRGLVSRKRWNDGRIGLMEDTEAEAVGESSYQSTRIQTRSD